MTFHPGKDPKEALSHATGSLKISLHALNNGAKVPLPEGLLYLEAIRYFDVECGLRGIQQQI